MEQPANTLRSTSFRLLWAGGVVSALGDWLLLIALPAYAYQLTGSPTAAGVTLAAEALPALLVGPFAGVLLDRWNLARAMALGNLAAAAAVALLPLADRPERVWLIYAAALGEQLAGTVLMPAGQAMTREVVGTGPELTTANALNATAGSVLRLVAPPLGAALMAGRGFTSVVVADIAGYLVAAACVTAAGRRTPARRTPGPHEPLGPQTVPADLRAGLAHVARTPLLRGPMVANALYLTANSALTALLVPLVVVRLHAPAYAIGHLVTGLGVGFLIGSPLAGRLLSRYGFRPVLIAAQAANALAYFALFDAPSLPMAVGAAALLGIPGSVLLIASGTHIQRTAPAHMQGRVGALTGATTALTTVVGGLCGPALVAAAGLGAALNGICGFALLAVAGTWLLVPA